MDINRQLVDRGYLVIDSFPQLIPSGAIVLLGNHHTYIVRPDTIAQLEEIVFEIDGSQLVFIDGHYVIFTDHPGKWIGKGGMNVKTLARSAQIRYLEIRSKPSGQYCGSRLVSGAFGMLITITFRRGTISAALQFEQMLKATQLVFTRHSQESWDELRRVIAKREWGQERSFRVQLTSDFDPAAFAKLEPALESIVVQKR
jgi:hypothetical protein